MGMGNTELFVSYLEETLAIAFPLVTHNNEMGEGDRVSLSEREAQNKRSSWSLSSTQEWLWIFVYVWEELPWYHLLEKKKKKQMKSREQNSLLPLYSQGLLKWRNQR